MAVCGNLATAALAFTVHRLVTVGVQEDGSIVIPNGRSITPAGEHIEVDDRPLGMVQSPRGDLLAVVTGSNFAPRALHLVDVASQTLKQTLPIANSFVGVAFSPAGDRIFVGGGASNDVKISRCKSRAVVAKPPAAAATIGEGSSTAQ